MMMKLGDFHKDVRQTLLFQIERAQLGVVHAEDFLFDFHQFGAAVRLRIINLAEVRRENRGHDDFAHVMDQAGNVIALAFGRFDQVHQFAGQQGRADAMPPELAPGKAPVLGQFLEIFDDRE